MGNPLSVAASRIIFSTAEDSFGAATQELIAAFGKGTKIERLGRDTGVFAAEGVDIARLAEVCQQRPLLFIQHLMREMVSLPSSVIADTMQPIYQAALDLLQGQRGAMSLALQVWYSADPAPVAYRSDELWKFIAARLKEHGMTVTRGSQARILSVCVTPQMTVLGINSPTEALTDWPGGRFGLAKSAEQISRAEFKLEELFKVFDVALPSKGIALDLGASPGGWTRLLRQRGLTVWAVDPANLDPRLVADAGVQHAQITAAAFLAETQVVFDVVVNDMRMDADLSCRVMVQAAPRLKAGGLAIVTLKLFQYKPLEIVHQALAILKQAYEIVHARQLFHNRHEVTVVARRRQ